MKASGNIRNLFKYKINQGFESDSVIQKGTRATGKADGYSNTVSSLVYQNTYGTIVAFQRDTPAESIYR